MKGRMSVKGPCYFVVLLCAVALSPFLSFQKQPGSATAAISNLLLSMWQVFFHSTSVAFKLQLGIIPLPGRLFSLSYGFKQVAECNLSRWLHYFA
jgi:hypothetical protein